MRRRVVEIKFHTAGAYGMPPYGVSLSQGTRGVMRLWRCAPAPYRVCALVLCRGGGCRFATTHILPPDVKLLFHCFISFHARFFFVSAGAKKKLSKRNAVKEMRRGGFLKKAPS